MVRVTFCVRRLRAPRLDFKQSLEQGVQGAECILQIVLYMWSSLTRYEHISCCMIQPNAAATVFPSCCDHGPAECGKLSRDNLQKIKCGTLRKLHPLSLFRSRKMQHFCASQNYRSLAFVRSLALYNRCATDA